MNRFLSSLAAAVFLAILADTTAAQRLVRHPDVSAPLAERWQWATSDAPEPCSQECWIAYSIHRMMDVDSYTGWYSTHDSGRPTLQSLVYGREVEPTPDAVDRSDVRRRASGSEMVRKEIALLFRFERGETAIRDIRISNISLPVALDALPLVWLGRAGQPESVSFLKDRYARTQNPETQEDLVSAAGMHDAADLVVPFLQEVLESGVDDEVREQAVFWLAETADADILPILERIARGDPSEDVREQAVFGVSRIETEAAEELLIDMARHLVDSETREEAIFWLGQKASRKAATHLEDIAENDPDFEMQKKAVFAISELPADEGVPRLISIARTHRNPKIRHEAIFWLGESGDPRAVDVLVEIVRGR